MTETSPTKNPPTNPKKKSLMPSTPLRRKLRGLGHALDSIVQIGHHGVTAGVVKQLTGALFDHELVKVKLGSECPQSRFEVAERLCEEPGVQVVQIVGKTILLYKRHPQLPRYEGASARVRAEERDERFAAKAEGKSSPSAKKKRPPAKRSGPRGAARGKAKLVKGRGRASRSGRSSR